jgi:exosortase/archaeosortase family protein
MGKKSREERSARAGAPEAGEAKPDWVRAKGPALRFVLVSAALMLLFYGVFYTSPEDSPTLNAFIRAYLGAYATTAGFVLDLFGADARAEGTTIWLGAKAVEVVRGCDAMEPIAFYVAAVIAIQTSLRSKLVGLLAGVPLLVLLNLVRIIALSVVSAHYPEHFETAHIVVGQTAFIVGTVCLWFVWVIRATRAEGATGAAAAG